ncbi:MAG: esterase-like activity of phytase family protein [Deltaproteobacteria bacterium]|nr:esterase-like activity of phytase family protein [Deltaproteobacteria bacterium]
MPKKLGRRELGRSVLGVGLSALGAPSCGSVARGAARGGAAAVAITGKVDVWSCYDLPADDPRSRELSGIAWDDATRTLFAVQDELAAIVPLRPDATFQRWSFGEAIRLDVPGPLDLEGIALGKDGFFLASEIGPRLLEVDRAGHHLRDYAPPPKFLEALRNKSFESLALDPSKSVLYTTSETALPRDDDASRGGTGARVRILQIDLATGAIREHAYATDAVVTGGGDYGVSDLTALATDDLLVLERGFRKGIGNSVRIHRVNLDDPRSACDGIERLSPEVPVLAKKLLVDLATLPADLASPPKQPQTTALMENYEGMTTGPRLPDGRLALFLVSDDNGSPKQTPRVLTLALG